MNLLEAMLSIHPRFRPTCDQILRHEYFKEYPYPCENDQLPQIQGDWHEYETKHRKPEDLKELTDVKKEKKGARIPRTDSRAGSEDMMSLDSSSDEPEYRKRRLSAEKRNISISPKKRGTPTYSSVIKADYVELEPMIRVTTYPMTVQFRAGNLFPGFTKNQ